MHFIDLYQSYVHEHSLKVISQTTPCSFILMLKSHSLYTKCQKRHFSAPNAVLKDDAKTTEQYNTDRLSF